MAKKKKAASITEDQIKAFADRAVRPLAARQTRDDVYAFARNEGTRIETANDLIAEFKVVVPRFAPAKRDRVKDQILIVLADYQTVREVAPEAAIEDLTSRVRREIIRRFCNNLWIIGGLT